MAKGIKTGGRQKGTPNKNTVEIREAARAFLADPKGQAMMLRQYQQGTLNPAVLSMLHHYAYGKPSEHIRVEGELPPFRLILEHDDRDDPAGG